jgi:hypothetical protein
LDNKINLKEINASVLSTFLEPHPVNLMKTNLAKKSRALITRAFVEQFFTTKQRPWRTFRLKIFLVMTRQTCEMIWGVGRAF